MMSTLFFLFLCGQVIQCQTNIRRLHFWIENFRQVTRRYPSNDCCWEETDREVCSPCSIRFSITSSFGSKELGENNNRVDFYKIEKDLFFTTQFGQACDNMSISALEWFTEKVIDVWRITCLNVQPGENYTVIDGLGVFRNMQATFAIWYECEGFAGPNCLKECRPTSRSYCDVNGELQCKEGFTGPPDCRLNSPCQNLPCRNGGECQARSTFDYDCVCSPQFTGKNCELEKCEPSKCAGRCENGECVCSSDKIDSSCTSYSCDGNFLCKNNGTCGVHGEEVFCLCPPHTFGAYCQFYCDPLCVNGKCIGNNRGNSVCDCFQNFIGDACEIELEPTETKPRNNDVALSQGYQAAIAVAVLFGLATICLAVKVIYDKYNKDILKHLLNKTNISSSSATDVADIGVVKH